MGAGAAPEPFSGYGGFPGAPTALGGPERYAKRLGYNRRAGLLRSPSATGRADIMARRLSRPLRPCASLAGPAPELRRHRGRSDGAQRAGAVREEARIGGPGCCGRHRRRAGPTLWPGRHPAPVHL